MVRSRLAILLLSVAAAVQMHAAAGSSCNTAIPLGDNYKANISGAGTVWYSAWTFDLPLAVYFAPQNVSDPAPEIEMDFTCTPGVYSDSILCSLFCPSSTSGIEFNMPHRPKLETGYLVDTTYIGDEMHLDSTFVYYLSMGVQYRNLLLKTGIDYNVKVLVKVTYKAGGTMSIAPDDMFSNCMDGHKFMHLGDTIRVVGNEKERHVILPYVQWQNDSIRLIWTGTQPARWVVGNTCDFDPTNYAQAVNIIELQPGDTFKYTSEQLQYYLEWVENAAGMFYGKCYSTANGVLKIERVPVAPPRGGAKLLEYDKPVTILPNDTNALFAIRDTMRSATQFLTPTNHIVRMYVGNGPDFTIENAVASYQFLRTDSGHKLGLLASEMQALWEQRPDTNHHYLYIRILCTAKTKVTPSEWMPSECFANKELIRYPSHTISVQPKGYGAVFYRFYYNDWKNGDMTFKGTFNASTCPVYIGDTCFFAASTNAHVITTFTLAKGTNKTKKLTAETINGWADRVDDEGYIYIRFNADRAGNMTISTNAPAEEDPEEPEIPAATIAVSCIGEADTETGAQTIAVTVSAEQDLVLKQGTTPVSNWHQLPTDAAHNEILAPGTYTLSGADEEVTIVIQ